MRITPSLSKVKPENIKLSSNVKPYIENVKSAMDTAAFSQVIAAAQIIAKENGLTCVSIVHIRLALEEIFGEAEADKLVHTSDDRAKANSVVYQAVERGLIPRAKTNHCAIDSCDNMAKVYHHWSYREEHRICVIPLCARCHALVHKGEIKINDPLNLSILPEGTTYLSLLKTR